MTEPIQSAVAEAAPGSGTTSFQKSGVFPYAMMGLLIALVVLIFTAPFVEQLENGDTIEGALLSLVLVSAVMAIGHRRRTLAVATLLVVPTLAVKWTLHLRPDLAPPAFFSVAGLLFLGYVVAHIFHFILRAPRVNTEVLCAGICGYLLLGLLWIFAYRLVEHLSPGAFVQTVGPAAGHAMKGFTFAYFSFITLCTVGYGDIVPVSAVGRMLAMMEAITGTFYMAVMIARLVALYSSGRSGPATDETK